MKDLAPMRRRLVHRCSPLSAASSGVSMRTPRLAATSASLSVRHQQGHARVPVPAAAPDFLVPAIDRLRQAGVHHRPDTGVIDSQGRTRRSR